MSRIKVDDKEFSRMIDRLTSEEVDKAMVSAVRSSAFILKKRTEINFADGTKFKAYNIYQSADGSKKRLPLVTVRVVKDEKMATVHIFGDFRAKFFELGTKRRFTKGRVSFRNGQWGKRKIKIRTGSIIKSYMWGNRRIYRYKPANRGIIEPRYYFKDAQEASKDDIFRDMSDRFRRAVIRIGRRKG